MDVKQIRKANLYLLKKEVRSWAEVARRAGTDPAYISQIVSKKAVREVGDDLARKLETGFSKPHGWMDHDHSKQTGSLFSAQQNTEQHGQYDNPSEASPISTNIAPGPRIKGRVPLISWVQAGNWTEAVDVFQPEDAEDWVISAFNHSDTAFALRVKGISMEPEFREGEIIIVDPVRCADPGKFVVAKKTNSNETTFKQLIQEGTEFYLKALNPTWPEPIIRMDEEWQISGVVIGKTKAY